MTTRISIVTPSYRSGDWLPLCIASVADQQGVTFEHLVQDGGSDDGTLDWLRTDTRVAAQVEPDKGMYDAVNRGLRRARGEILGYLNCDEQYLPGALSAIDDYFRTHRDVDVVFADTVVVDHAGSYLFHRQAVAPQLWHTQVCHLNAPTCSTFFRRQLLDERGVWFDPTFRYVGDAEWMVRLLRAGARTGVLRRFTSAFTHTGQNLSLHPQAVVEQDRLRQAAPPLARWLKPALVLHHRGRRAMAGAFTQQPFEYALFTKQSPRQRQTKRVSHPTGRWRW